jgi:hypothetical protein
MLSFESRRSIEKRPSVGVDDADTSSTTDTFCKSVIMLRESFATGAGGDWSLSSSILSRAGEGRDDDGGSFSSDTTVNEDDTDTAIGEGGSDAAGEIIVKESTFVQEERFETGDGRFDTGRL